MSEAATKEEIQKPQQGSSTASTEKSPDESRMQEIKSMLWQALPLALLFLSSFLVQNVLQILLVVALIMTFDGMNDFVAKMAIRPRELPTPKVIIVIAYMTGIIYLSRPAMSSNWLFAIGDLYHWWMAQASFWPTVLMVTVMDFVAKYITISMKCVILVLSGKVVSLQNRGRVFMALEGSSQILRCILPIPEWSKYILMSEHCFSGVICWMFLALYAILKFKAIKKKLVVVLHAYKYRTLKELKTADTRDITTLQGVRLCPICHEGFVEPVRLLCGHIFCSGCASMWCDREQYCPRCNSDATNSYVLGLTKLIPPLIQHTSTNSKWKTGVTDYVIQFF